MSLGDRIRVTSNFIISNHKDRRETGYALVTTHSLIPKCSDVKRWKIEFFGSTHIAEEMLVKYVHSIVSCCGKENSSNQALPLRSRMGL